MNFAFSSHRQSLPSELLTASPNSQEAEVSGPARSSPGFWVAGRRGCFSGHCDDSPSINPACGLLLLLSPEQV